MAKVRIESYGCSASMADSEMIAGLLKSNGHELVSDVNGADVNLIVTCAVKDVTANRMVYRIKDLTMSGKPLVVAGCLAKAEPDRIERLSPGASMLGPHAIDRAVDVVNTAINGGRSVVLTDSTKPKVNLPRLRFNPVVSIVEIASGCVSECTFCETKLAKGRLRSYRIGDIVRQVREDVRQGCREVWLTSTDNGPYGRDLKCNLAHLIDEVSNVEGDFMIRVGMMNPMHIPFMLEDLVEAYRNDKVFKFLHIPVQSGSDKILRLMKRGHRAALFADITRRFRDEFKQFTIATDVIAGFPEEDEVDFQQTLELLKEVEPDVINISKYSARPRTEASLMKKVNVKIVKERTRELHQLANSIGYRRNRTWQDWRGEILVDEITDDGVRGRNFAYKPVFVKEKVVLGWKTNVKINRISRHFLFGKIQK
ncbi:MAG TPA: tRNA (N(6)-L-threonylcarbamoyladenosine(37)-C(2))-methylthiotransferase [Nitrososphaerales archaeon]|nr:tRNA (N(6)-L-threonylcarbamoyladenosine(37)-C(2))-methylthiotransferase [Nitrososphaerales archaeon]